MGEAGSEVARLSAALRPVCEAQGLDLEHLEVASAGRRRLLRVVVDRDGGVDLDAVAEISREISGALDAADVMGPVPYVLEVSSPGVDRPLVRPVHWRRAADRLVRVELHGGRVLEGRVMSVEESGVLLRVAGAPEEIRVALAEVVRAHVQVEFSRVGAAADLESAGELRDGEEGR